MKSFYNVRFTRFNQISSIYMARYVYVNKPIMSIEEESIKGL